MEAVRARLGGAALAVVVALGPQVAHGLRARDGESATRLRRAPPEPKTAPTERAGPDDLGSLVTFATLAPGRVGMSVGGGVAILLAVYAFEVGVGLAEDVDLTARFESVVGLLHYPTIAVRWTPVHFGAWRLGFKVGLNYSFFGLQTDHLNLTSTFYLSFEVGMSVAVTRATDIVFSVAGELDIFEYDVVDDDAEIEGSGRYDATLLRLGVQSSLTEDLDVYVVGRLRIPTETFRYEAQDFIVLPIFEAGATWSF